MFRFHFFSSLSQCVLDFPCELAMHGVGVELTLGVWYYVRHLGMGFGIFIFNALGIYTDLCSYTGSLSHRPICCMLVLRCSGQKSTLKLA
jgi:hypothetical protein